MLDQATEQMATPQRADHNGDITTLRLKSPLKHTHMHTDSVTKGKVFLFIIYICERPNTRCALRTFVKKRKLICRRGGGGESVCLDVNK